MLKRFAILFLLYAPLWLAAQYDAPLRIELESAKDQDDYTLAPADTFGLFVLYEGNRIADDTTSWVFLHYDTNLHKDYHFIVPFPLFTELIDYSKTDNYLYFILQKRFPKKAPVQTFLMEIDLKKNKYNLQQINEFDNTKIDRLYARDHEVIIHATQNKTDSLFFYHTLTQQLTPCRQYFDYTLEFCELDTFNQRWLFGLIPAQGKNFGQIILYEHNYEKNSDYTQPFPTIASNTIQYSYNTARAVVINKDTTLIIGTYNVLQDRNSSNQHSGVYTMQLFKNQLDSAKFFNYASLKTKISNPETEGAYREHVLNFQLLVGNISHNSHKFTLATEVFYPEYNYSNSGYDYYYGNSLPQTTTTFAGYRFVNAYVTTFDAAGNLISDYYFPYSNLLSQQLSNRLSIEYINDNALMFYPNNNYITHTLLHDYDVISRITDTRIENNSAQDLVQYNQKTHIFRWYNDYYLATGYQYIVQKKKVSKSKRYVFYFNKFLYR